MQQCTVGKLASEANVNIETISYYENIGLMSKPKRLESDCRIYSDTALKRLLFIKHSKSLGFFLKKIKELLFLKVNEEKGCDYVRTIAENNIKEIELKIKEMSKIKKVLKHPNTHIVYSGA